MNQEKNTLPLSYYLSNQQHFHIESNFWIIDNNTYNSLYGSDQNQFKYKVDTDFITINTGEYTKVLVTKVPTTLNTTINASTKYVEGYTNNNNPTDATISNDQITTVVSYLSNCDWYNGQFKNGIFDGNFFRDGIWEKGVMKSGNFGY